MPTVLIVEDEERSCHRLRQQELPDVRIGRINGFEVAATIKTKHLDVAVLLMSGSVPDRTEGC